MALLKEYANGYPCLAEQPKVIQKLRLYHTNMHLRLCHIQRQRLYRTVLDSTLIPRDNVRAETETHRHEQKYKDIVKHLEKNDSSNRHVCQLRMRGLCEGEALCAEHFLQDHASVYRANHGGAPDGFHRASSTSIGLEIENWPRRCFLSSHSTNLTSPY